MTIIVRIGVCSLQNVPDLGVGCLIPQMVRVCPGLVVVASNITITILTTTIDMIIIIKINPISVFILIITMPAITIIINIFIIMIVITIAIKNVTPTIDPALADRSEGGNGGAMSKTFL